jgi:hypothetical protein
LGRAKEHIAFVFSAAALKQIVQGGLMRNYCST